MRISVGSPGCSSSTTAPSTTSSGGPRGLLDRIPAHKTLFHAPKHRGLPIGNLNSQFFANVYLNGLDQFVTHRLRCRHYLRYCDDFVLLSRSREELLAWREAIAGYLHEELRLEINEKRQRLRPVANGIDFLGYIVRADYLLVRRRVVNQFRERLRELEARLVTAGRSYRRYLFDPAVLAQLQAILASYLGHFRLANTTSLCRSLWARYPFLAQYFSYDPETKALVGRHRFPRTIRRIRQQYGYFRWRFPGDVLLFQMGRFFEFYQMRDDGIARVLGLSRMRENAQRARYGFPVALLGPYVRRLFRYRAPVTVVLETDRYWTGIKERVPAYRFEPLRTR